MSPRSPERERRGRPIAPDLDLHAKVRFASALRSAAALAAREPVEGAASRRRSRFARQREWVALLLLCAASVLRPRARSRQREGVNLLLTNRWWGGLPRLQLVDAVVAAVATVVAAAAIDHMAAHHDRRGGVGNGAPGGWGPPWGVGCVARAHAPTASRDENGADQHGEGDEGDNRGDPPRDDRHALAAVTRG